MEFNIFTSLNPTTKSAIKMKPFLTLIVGAFVGWLFGTLNKKSSIGLLGNILIGIPGAYVGYWSFRQVGVFFHQGLLSGVIRGAIGALVILLIFNLIFKKR